ncbi:hypothetical protein C1H46_038619 [Malus baccata]|uniref:At1g61320/AtMIF1 LRR domain-containing protein n=1 Tax=Malus baccata TaxID=106549 RepID=A0A540KNS2_MALBA|nr:hypothetical protein C1H46_038619 [Malus baccata]
MLKRLVLEVGDFYDTGSGVNEMVLVVCPNLYLIDFNGCWFKQLVLENASSLVEFRVDVMHLMEGYNYWSMAVRLLEQVPHLKFKFLTSKDTLPKSFMLYNLLNRLELRTGFTQYDLVGMAALLKISPNLEILILDYLRKFSEDVSTFTRVYQESLPGELLDKPVEFSMPRLKQVTLKVYNDTEAQVEFIEMLIRLSLKSWYLFPANLGRRSRILQWFSIERIYRIGSTFSPSPKSIETPSFRWGIHWLRLVPRFLAFSTSILNL